MISARPTGTSAICSPRSNLACAAIGLRRQHAIERQPRQVVGRPQPPDQLLVGLEIAAEHQAEIANDPEAMLRLARRLGRRQRGGERLLGRAGNQAGAAPAVAMGAVDAFEPLARRLEQFIERAFAIFAVLCRVPQEHYGTKRVARPVCAPSAWAAGADRE